MNIFPNGTKYALSSAIAAATAVTAISNANPAVATAAAPPADGSVVIIASTWSALDETLARTDGATANGFELEGIDTTSLTNYPAGEGAGSVQVVSAWTTIDQITASAAAGGDQQFATYQYVEDPKSRQRQKPTFKNARTVTLTLDYDPTKPWHAALKAADASNTPQVLRTLLPNGDTMLYLAYVSFNDVPTQDVNKGMSVTAVFSLVCDPIRYAAGA